MASKKTPEPNVQENETQEVLEAAKTGDELLNQAEALRKENERLKAQLAAAKKAPVQRKTDRQVLNEAIAEALAEGKNTWDVKVAIRARPRTGTTEKHYWLGVNGRFLAVPADDKYHEMALPFAECLLNSMDAENFVKEFADREIKVYDLISNPHEEERER